MKEITSVAASAGIPPQRVAEIIGAVVFRHCEGNVRSMLLSELDRMTPTAGPRAVGEGPIRDSWS